MDDSDEKVIFFYYNKKIFFFIKKIEEIYFMIRDNEKGLSITNKKTKFKHCKNCFHGKNNNDF